MVSVDPKHTNKSYHVGCSYTHPGKPKPTPQHYDIVPCSACGEWFNIHENTAKHVALRVDLNSVLLS